jgi:fido (protein-threonine AMPylation protein)
MARPQEKLAESLETLRELQERGIVAVRSRDLSRTHRERLQSNGFLKEVMKGWYIPSRPDETPGDSTTWYASFWDFCAAYLNERFGEDWCLSPEQSISLHTGNRTVPTQLLVRSPKGGNKPTALPFDTSLFDVRLALPKEDNLVEKDGLRLYSVPAALVACPKGIFRQASTDVRAALAMIKDASDVLAILLEGGHSTIAGRLAGAFRNAGRERVADQIIRTMKNAGYTVSEADPFESAPPIVLGTREASPYVNRMRLMWEEMRGPISERFPASPGLPKDIDAYLKHVEEIYVTDAYHSLSIEGYRVSAELIERVRSGAWNPDDDETDREHRNALAARGYWQAYQVVQESLEKILGGENPGAVVDDDHSKWYGELFGPSVVAGIIQAVDLAGYRNGPVHIRRSMHVPPPGGAVRDCMPAYFDLLKQESDPAVRVVLGHFIFVHIHPYMDGNGRLGRFLMNSMMASGGYPWTVIPVDQRDAYMAALEDASVRQNIVPFTEFLAKLVDDGMKGKSAPSVPFE